MAEIQKRVKHLFGKSLRRNWKKMFKSDSSKLKRNLTCKVLTSVRTRVQKIDSAEVKKTILKTIRPYLDQQRVFLQCLRTSSEWCATCRPRCASASRTETKSWEMLSYIGQLKKQINKQTNKSLKRLISQKILSWNFFKLKTDQLKT